MQPFGFSKVPFFGIEKSAAALGGGAVNQAILIGTLGKKNAERQ
jgi:hypothetical protein